MTYRYMDKDIQCLYLYLNNKLDVIYATSEGDYYAPIAPDTEEAIFPPAWIHYVGINFNPAVGNESIKVIDNYELIDEYLFYEQVAKLIETNYKKDSYNHLKTAIKHLDNFLKVIEFIY